MKAVLSILFSLASAIGIAYVVAYRLPLPENGAVADDRAESKPTDVTVAGETTQRVSEPLVSSGLKHPQAVGGKRGTVSRKASGAPSAVSLITRRPDSRTAISGGDQDGKLYRRFDLTLSIPDPGVLVNRRNNTAILLRFDNRGGSSPYHALAVTHQTNPEGLAVSLLVIGGDAGTLMSRAVIPTESLPDGALELTLRHRDEHIGVMLGDTVLCDVTGFIPAGGLIELDTFGDIPVPETTLRPLDMIELYDGFFRIPSDPGDWRVVRGKPEQFQTKTLRNELEGVNAFSMMGYGKGTIALFASAQWETFDNYRAVVNLRGPENGKLGIVFNYRDNDNYALFRWSARKRDEKGNRLGRGVRELTLVHDGKETVLASEKGGYISNQWYRVQLVSVWGHVEIIIDGHRLLSADHPALTAGGVGLWCDVATPKPDINPYLNREKNELRELMAQHAVFDDVSINSLRGFADHFNGESGTMPGGWRGADESGSVESAAGLDGYGHLVLSGVNDWVRPAPSATRYRLTARVASMSADSMLSLSPYFRGGTATGAEFQLFATGEGVLKSWTPDGGISFRQCVVRNFSPNRPFTLSIRQDKGHYGVYYNDDYNDDLLVDSWIAETLRGPVRLHSNGARVVLDALIADPISEPPLPVMKNMVFEAETHYMETWQSIDAEWRKQGKLTINGETVSPIWNRMIYPGDSTMTIAVRNMARDTDFQLVASICKNGTKKNGYTFSVTGNPADEPDAGNAVAGEGDDADAAGGDAKGKEGGDGEKVQDVKKRYRLKLTLNRNADTVETSSVVIDGPLQSVTMRRVGTFVVGSVNGHNVVRFQDPDPLTSGKVAFFSRGLDIALEKTHVSSADCIDNFFTQAPWDWRVSRYGIAMVANRWQCDPRWTFMTLQSDSYSLKNGMLAPHEKRLAVLWSKRQFDGEVLVDYFVGPKMNQLRDQRYKYARDFNVTICADGKTLSSGYTFRLMGYGNRSSDSPDAPFPPSQLLRGKDVVGVSNGHMGRGIHRDWFNIRIERKNITVKKTVNGKTVDKPAAEIRVWVNDKENGSSMCAIQYVDENPLEGKYVAIWTYDMGLVLPRVRVAGIGADRLETPDFVPAWDLDSPVTQ